MLLLLLFWGCVWRHVFRQITTPTRQHTHTHPFNGPLSGTTRGVIRYQKGKPIWILLKQETVSGSGISWAICKSAPSSRQITMPAPHRSVFYRPDALPAAQPTASKHWRQTRHHSINFFTGLMLFLTPNQQRQSTEGTTLVNANTTASAAVVLLV